MWRNSKRSRPAENIFVFSSLSPPALPLPATALNLTHKCYEIRLSEILAPECTLVCFILRQRIPSWRGSLDGEHILVCAKPSVLTQVEIVCPRFIMCFHKCWCRSSYRERWAVILLSSVEVNTEKVTWKPKVTGRSGLRKYPQPHSSSLAVILF